MSRAERGLFWDMAAFAWDADEPGTINLPLQDFAKLLGVSQKVLRKFLEKFPKTFVKLSESLPQTFDKLDSTFNKFIQPKLNAQWTNYKEISEKRRKAAETRYANAEHKDHSASASSSASAFASAPNTNTKKPSAEAKGTPARVALTEREEFSRAQFKMFWAIYPNKIDEDGTFIMWLGLSPIDQSEIVERLPAWVACGQWQEGTRFIPYPKRFLKERMWKSTPPNGGSNGTRQSNKAEQRRERGQQISKNVFGRSSGLVGALTSDLEGRSNGGTGAHLPRDSKGLEAGHTPQSISPSDKDLQVPANPVGSHRGGKH
jgi:hypothetical protein